MIRECRTGAAVFICLRMGLRPGIFSGWIARWSVNRAEAALAGEAALQLGAHLVGSPLFQGISATRCEQQQSE